MVALTTEKNTKLEIFSYFIRTVPAGLFEIRHRF